MALTEDYTFSNNVQGNVTRS